VCNGTSKIANINEISEDQSERMTPKYLQCDVDELNMMSGFALKQILFTKRNGMPQHLICMDLYLVIVQRKNLPDEQHPNYFRTLGCKLWKATRSLRMKTKRVL